MISKLCPYCHEYIDVPSKKSSLAGHHSRYHLREFNVMLRGQGRPPRKFTKEPFEVRHQPETGGQSEGGS